MQMKFKGSNKKAYRVNRIKRLRPLTDKLPLSSLRKGSLTLNSLLDKLFTSCVLSICPETCTETVSGQITYTSNCLYPKGILCEF